MERKGLLLVMMRPPVHLEEEYTEWYDTEHLADRMTAPGFLAGNRFRSTSGGPHGFLTLYDLESSDVLDTPEYKKLSRDNFTPWTKRLMRRIPRLRVLADQLDPGSETLNPAPFLTMLRFAAISEGGAATVVDGIKSCVAGNSAMTQVRIFEERDGGDFAYLALIGSITSLASAVTVDGLGPAAGSLRYVEEFAPHYVGMTWEKWI